MTHLYQMKLNAQTVDRLLGALGIEIGKKLDFRDFPASFWHSFVMKLFGKMDENFSDHTHYSKGSARSKGGVLFNIYDNKIMLIQSAVEPFVGSDLANDPAVKMGVQVEEREIPNVRDAKSVRLALNVNSIERTERVIVRPVSIKDVKKNGDDTWLLGALNRASEAELFNFIHVFELRRDTWKLKPNKRGGGSLINDFVICEVDFTEMEKEAKQSAFEHLIISGVGRAKNYGCGLILPIEIIY